MVDLTAIILTFNEEKNIIHCIESIRTIAKRIVVIDSFSTDNTVAIAKELGAEVYQHEFVNQAKQYIWGVEVADIRTKWVFRIDADERLTPESSAEIQEICRENENTDLNGIVVRFKVTFMGKDLRYGGYYPFCKLLVYKNGKAYMEDRGMDEHIILTEGRSVELQNDSLHCDYKGLSAWIDKHNKYASREAEAYFHNSLEKKIEKGLNPRAKIKRFMKLRVYYKLPMGLRAHLYYIYRYYFKLGFLDGKEGKIFTFMQAYWYRYLVDAKIYEKRSEK